MTKFPIEVQNYILHREKQGATRTDIAKGIIEKFEDYKNHKRDGLRAGIRRFIKEFDGYIHRGQALQEFCEEQGIHPQNAGPTWVKTDKHGNLKGISMLVKNNLGEQEDLEELAKSLIEEMKEYAPKYPKIKREKSKDGHLIVVSLTDLHIGKLCTEFATGDDYNTQKAIDRAIEGVQGLLDKSYGFNIDKILFIGGHDILHVDTPRNTTTSGTQQDVSGMWYDNFLEAKRLYIKILEMLMQVADVEFYYCPSNHDWTSGFFLCQTIEARFKGCNNIEFHVDLQHRKYYKYGNSLIGVSHGDGAKENLLGMIMSTEAKEYWSDCEHRYFYLGHLHHRIAKEYPNVTVEYTRSPSGTDRRHADNGYISSKAIEGFIHSKDHGQIAKFTHIFK